MAQSATMLKDVSVTEAADASVSDEMRALGDYVSGALAQTVPEDVLEKGRHHLLDTLAAMVSGSRPSRCAISCPMQFSRPPACSAGRATTSISRRLSISAA